MIAMLYVIYGLEADREKPVDWFFWIGVILWTVVARMTLCVHERSQRWTTAIAILAIATVAWIPVSFRHYDVCPHGQRWANNQIGIAKSANGGPCGNGSYGRHGHLARRVVGQWYVFVPQRY
ncbi:MAG: hypothetical protein H7Z14_05260 [Anaerolineae bacterium]|nr:hypothetical protein [Phycisphaerae bacterium]